MADNDINYNNGDGLVTISKLGVFKKFIDVLFGRNTDSEIPTYKATDQLYGVIRLGENLKYNPDKDCVDASGGDPIYVGDDEPEDYNFWIDTDEESGGEGVSRLLVNFTLQSGATYVADKTNKEIYEAHSGGTIVMGLIGDKIYTLTSINFADPLYSEVFEAYDYTSSGVNVYKLVGSDSTASGVTYTYSSKTVNNTTYTAGTGIDISSGKEISVDASEISYNSLKDLPTIPSLDNYYDKTEADTLLNTKQGLLTAGTNITIDDNNVISASGGGGSDLFVITITGTTSNKTNAEIYEAYTAGKIIIAKRIDYVYTMCSCGETYAFFAAGGYDDTRIDSTRYARCNSLKIVDDTVTIGGGTLEMFPNCPGNTVGTYKLQAIVDENLNTTYQWVQE